MIQHDKESCIYSFPLFQNYAVDRKIILKFNLKKEKDVGWINVAQHGSRMYCLENSVMTGQIQ
jgi:hypothetical protein